MNSGNYSAQLRLTHTASALEIGTEFTGYLNTDEYVAPYNVCK